jgi:hypothetical protein
MDKQTQSQLAGASIGAALLSDCLAAPTESILLTDEMRQSFADLCAAFDLLNERLERQKAAGKANGHLGAEFGKLGGRPKKRK